VWREAATQFWVERSRGGGPLEFQQRGLWTESISVRGVGLDQRKAQSDSEEANEHA